MAATYNNINGLFKIRYANWIEPLPDVHTLADDAPFVPSENRPGLGYSFPLLSGLPHGQTADNTNNAFLINPAVDGEIVTALLDGSTILIQEVVAYDMIYKSLNGSGNGNQGGAFMTALDQLVKGMLLSGNLYRELALAYGPGSSTAATSNIGVLSATAGGTLNTAQQVIITEATWISGLWIVAKNMKVDILVSAGTSERETGVSVINRVNTTQSRITLQKVGSGATPTIGDQIVPFGWRTKSAVGIEGIYNNTGTLFGINAANVAAWQCQIFAAGGQMTRAKILGYCAQISINGVHEGGKLYVSAPTFADLSEEAAQLQRYTGNTDKVKRQGASVLTYETACGVLDVVVYAYQKQGQAFFVANDNMKRVGSTDLTMKPIGGGAQGFFTHMTDRSGAQMKLFSNQAPLFEKPFQNFMINGIVNSTSSGKILAA